MSCKLSGEREIDFGAGARPALAVVATANPVMDYRGSAEYRRAMAGVLVRRAVEAVGRAVAV